MNEYNRYSPINRLSLKLLKKPAGIISTVAGVAALIVLFGPVGNAGTGEAAEKPGITVTYPKNGTLFPPDMASPTFRWTDSSPAVSWLITVESREGGKAFSASSPEPGWKPGQGDWQTLKDLSLERDARVVIRGFRDASGEALSEGSIVIRTSKDPVGAPIFYRDVPLPAAKAGRELETIVWRLGRVSEEGLPAAVLTGMKVCANCHSFPADGKRLAMDFDFANDKGSYVIKDIAGEVVIQEEDVITWSDYRREDGDRTFGLLSQISPDGRHVVSTVKDFSVFRYLPDTGNSQLFFPVKGILVVYDTETNEFRSLPGADDPGFVQTNPEWMPDGKSIIFARAQALSGERNEISKSAGEFVSGKSIFRYDLFRIPFNDGKGGKAEPLHGAFANGRSNYFAKVSPDGRWIVFCQSNSFMLNQPDSRLHIMPASGGVPRKLRSNSEKGMNSWHSWSPNGKWLVFASKENGPYTQLWLTHIDDEGNDTPPVLLENFTGPERAANIPEFVNLPPGEIFTIRLGESYR